MLSDVTGKLQMNLKWLHMCQMDQEVPDAFGNRMALELKAR